MICTKCNNPGIFNKVLGNSFYYCRNCKVEINLINSPLEYQEKEYLKLSPSGMKTLRDEEIKEANTLKYLEEVNCPPIYREVYEKYLEKNTLSLLERCKASIESMEKCEEEGPDYPDCDLKGTPYQHLSGCGFCKAYQGN